MTEPVLAVAGLTKTYGELAALDGVDLLVEPGEIVGLLGPNGAGKTTLVSIVCGLRRADSGTVRVNGVDALTHPERARRHIGLAPQELGIYPIDTVRQNLVLFAELAGLSGTALRTEVEGVAHALMLEGLLDRKAGELSGGQKRRLHTAIAILNRPPLILLDEATAGADVETRTALLGIVSRLAADGSSVVYSTHYLQEVESLEARVVIVDRGRIIARGSVPDLVAKHGGAYIELGFEGAPPGLGGRWSVTTDGNVMRVAVGDPSREIGAVFESLRSGADSLVSVEFISPSLETVFLTLTGRRYATEEMVDVVAS